jgi:6,7-dimethyl-8-ribityllumazine synthase
MVSILKLSVKKIYSLMKKKILIVVSNYYKKVSDNLIIGATNTLKDSKYEYDIIYAPGCFEIPYLINQNIDNYFGFISLGCVIRGETYHFEVISNECGRKIMDLSLKYKKPIGFGILTCDTLEQAVVRSDPNQKNKGGEASIACIELLKYNLNK